MTSNDEWKLSLARSLRRSVGCHPSSCTCNICWDGEAAITAALQEAIERGKAGVVAAERDAFRHGKAYILAQLENPDEALVEAVAPAIYEADPEGGYYEDDPSSYWMAEGFSEHVWTIWRATAREAIRALARTLAEGESNDG